MKVRKTGRNTTGIREARLYGAGCVYMQIRLPGYMTTTPGDSCNDCGEEDAMFFDPYNVTLECSYCGEVHCL